MSFRLLKAAFGRFYDLPEDATKRDVEDRINAVAQQDQEVRLYARDLMLYTIARELSELRRQIGRVVKDDLTPMGGALDAIADVVEGLGERLQELAAHELADEDDDDEGDGPDTEDERPVDREPAEPAAKRVRAPVEPVDQAERELAEPEPKRVRAPRPRKATGEPKSGKRDGGIVVTEEAKP